jgi:hypothetical protein
MTIDEAVEIRRNWQHYPADRVNTADHVIVQDYFWLTDPTPLTRELIEKELGKPDKYGRWRVGECCLGWNTSWKHARCNGMTFTTLGRLRQIVAMLRNG